MVWKLILKKDMERKKWQQCALIQEFVLKLHGVLFAICHYEQSITKYLFLTAVR